MTIKELREKYNLTQSALARSLGVSSNAISGIEAGRIKLSPKMSAKIKEVYGEEVTTPAVEKKAAAKKSAKAEAVPALEKKDSVESAVDEKAAEIATSAAAPAPEKKRTKKGAPKKAAEPEAAPALEKKDTVEPAVDEKAAEIATPAAAPAPEKKRAKKSTAKKTDKAVTSEAVAPAPEKKATKKAAPKKLASEKPTKKEAPAAMKAPTVILQSPFGGEVTAEEILSKVGEVDKVYVRIDQNKLYWVKGKETGDKDIW